MSKWRSVTVLHAVEKTFLVAQPVQLVALTSGMLPGFCCLGQFAPPVPASSSLGRELGAGENWGRELEVAN